LGEIEQGSADADREGLEPGEGADRHMAMECEPATDAEGEHLQQQNAEMVD
jgi:hypothetical protein